MTSRRWWWRLDLSQVFRYKTIFWRCPRSASDNLRVCSVFSDISLLAWHWQNLFFSFLHQAVCCGIIRGSGRPKIGVIINFFFYDCVGMPLAIVLSFYVFKSVKGTVQNGVSTNEFQKKIFRPLDSLMFTLYVFLCRVVVGSRGRLDSTGKVTI